MHGARARSYHPYAGERNFRDDLERAGVSGTRSETGYYRLLSDFTGAAPISAVSGHPPSTGFLKNADVTTSEGKQSIFGVIDILHRQAACRCVVDPLPEADTPVSLFLEELRAMDSMHFDD